LSTAKSNAQFTVNDMSNATAIHCEKLTKHYFIGLKRQRIEAVNDVSFEVKSGEVFAFLGLNGAGKTTTIKMLLDQARPTAGRAYLFGVDAARPEARLKVGFQPDLPNFYRFLTGYELLDYFGRLFGLPRPERNKRIEVLLKQVGLDGRGNEPLKGFSRGMLQRIGLAQALINDPQMLILDEPLGGLDPVGRYDLRHIIMDLKTQGKTIFFSSHILEDAERIADRAAIIHQGKMLACGTLTELQAVESGWQVEIEPVDIQETNWLLDSRGWMYKTETGIRIIDIPDREGVNEIAARAAAGSLRLISITPKRRTLEDAFLAKVEG